MYLDEAKRLHQAAVDGRTEDPKRYDLAKASYWLGWRSGRAFESGIEIGHKRKLPDDPQEREMVLASREKEQPLNEDDFSGTVPR